MIVWSSLLIPAEVMFRIKPMLTMGPVSFSGKRQKIGTDAGYWTATMSGFPVLSPDRILEWRGIIGALQGGLEDLLIGPFDEFQAPTLGGLPPIIGGIPHSDGSLFSDGSGYSQSTILVSSSGDLDLRRTSARFLIERAGPIKRGMYFTVRSGGRPSMHMITKPPEKSGGFVDVEFLPPLRFDLPNGSEVDFADPKMLMNLSSPESGDLPLDMGRWSRPSIELEESWNGL
ncbi:hypothetical protein G8E10_17730 [Rhizobiaceae bacterium CRRU44]|uniref:Uncharacterized protein n=1 Tax=Ferranicluibacter rubi TaxID=2715133 RepID=A0AA43ZIK8_9HYPH|nr:hypothetical protein [Ferranicluibacter rubi]NHT77557.1 hypothetical protein [Ferranicluibacter rubi]